MLTIGVMHDIIVTEKNPPSNSKEKHKINEPVFYQRMNGPNSDSMFTGI